jgi:hypothetical protein
VIKELLSSSSNIFAPLYIAGYISDFEVTHQLFILLYLCRAVLSLISDNGFKKDDPKGMTQKRSKPSRAPSCSSGISDLTQSLPLTNDAQQFFDMAKAIIDLQITGVAVPHCHCSHNPPEPEKPLLHGGPTPKGNSPQQSPSTLFTVEQLFLKLIQQTLNSLDSAKKAALPEYVSIGQLKQLFKAVLQQKPQPTPEGPASEGPASGPAAQKNNTRDSTRSSVCAWRPIPRLPTKLSSAAMRAEAGESAERRASPSDTLPLKSYCVHSQADILETLPFKVLTVKNVVGEKQRRATVSYRPVFPSDSMSNINEVADFAILYRIYKQLESEKRLAKLFARHPSVFFFIYFWQQLIQGLSPLLVGVQDRSCQHVDLSGHQWCFIGS